MVVDILLLEALGALLATIFTPLLTLLLPLGNTKQYPLMFTRSFPMTLYALSSQGPDLHSSLQSTFLLEWLTLITAVRSRSSLSTTVLPLFMSNLATALPNWSSWG